MTVSAWHYRQFDADFDRPVPGEGYGGWHRAPVPFDPAKTALVVMHAWDTGTRDAFPGWHRAVEYLPRADQIVRDVLPPLMDAVRAAGGCLIHVTGGGDYYSHLPGFRAGDDSAPGPRLPADDHIAALHAFRAEHVFVGRHNEADVRAGFARLDFPEPVRPLGAEPVADTASGLDAICRERGVRHLVYAGFAINWCLLMSPGGMLDMSRRGYVCSAIRDAVTAVENRESARTEGHKEEALWRTALAFGFVFDSADLVAAWGA